jgi:predicted dehydrogenase
MESHTLLWVLLGSAVCAALLPALRRLFYFFFFLPHISAFPPKDNTVFVYFGLLGISRITRTAILLPTLRNQYTKIESLAARDFARTKFFASTHGIPEPCVSYLDLLSRPSSRVNAVYISLPNGLHHLWAKQALLAGKHCLCEKPLAANAKEVRDLVETANRLNLVLMEANHCFHHPALLRARTLLQQLGPIRRIEASFHSKIENREDIRYNCNGRDVRLAGGCCMDNGVYLINGIRFFLHPYGLDLSPSCVFAKADVVCSGQVDSSMEAELQCEQSDAITARIRCSFTAGVRNWWDFIPTITVTCELGVLTVFNFLLPNLLHGIRVESFAKGTTSYHQCYDLHTFSTRTTYDYQLEEFVRRIAKTHRSQDTLCPIRTFEVLDAIYIRAGLHPRHGY